jgi:hypothetical protein
MAGVWGYLAWRDRERWRAVLAVGSGAAAAAGVSASGLSNAAGRLLRFLESLLPRDAFGWGTLTVIAAFVLLAAGARRSLRRGSRPPSGDAPPPVDPHRRRGREAAAALLSLVMFALTATASALDAFPRGHPEQTGAAVLALLVAAAAFVMAVRAGGQATGEDDPTGQRLARLAMTVSAFGILFSLATLGAPRPHPGRSESATIGDIRTVISAQAAYESANGGLFDSRLACLETPAECIPGYPPDGPAFLGAELSSLRARNGYTRSFLPGAPADDRSAASSATATRSFAYIAVPTELGHSGVRGFCGDSGGVLCFTPDGKAPGVGPDGRCDLATCTALQ